MGFQNQNFLFKASLPEDFIANPPDTKTRIEKVRQLRNLKVGVNVASMNKSILNGIIFGNEQPFDLDVPIKVQERGIAFVTADYDEGDPNTSVFFYNQPVCVNLSNPRHVTGVKSTWLPDEFYIVGIALEGSGSATTSKLIPVKLVDKVIVPEGDIPFVLRTALTAGGNAKATRIGLEDNAENRFDVYDSVHQNIAGPVDSFGFAQNVNGFMAVKTLTCLTE